MKEDLLYAVWAMETLVSSGVGIESAIKHVAEANYREVSKRFQHILKEPGSLEDALNKHAITAPKPLRKILNAISTSVREEVSLADSLHRIAERETERRKKETASFIESLTTISEFFLVLAILVPIIVVVISFTSQLISATPWGGGIMALSPAMLRVILVGNLAVLALMVTWVKLMER